MRLFGVKVEAQPSILVPGAMAAVTTYVLLPNDRRRVSMVLASILLWYEAELTHVISHMISAHLAGAPMDRIRLQIIPATLYDNNDVSPQQHIGRSLGGPIGSTIAMLSWWMIWRVRQGKPGGRLALIGLIANSIIALGSWLPLPFVDGGVILKNIGRLD